MIKRLIANFLYTISVIKKDLSLRDDIVRRIEYRISIGAVKSAKKLTLSVGLTEGDYELIEHAYNKRNLK